MPGRDVSVHSCSASASLRLFAQPNLYCSRVSDTALPRLPGLDSTGPADLSAETGSGSTPLNGALSIATVTAASAFTGDLLRDEAAEAVPDDGGRPVELR